MKIYKLTALGVALSGAGLLLIAPLYFQRMAQYYWSSMFLLVLGAIFFLVCLFSNNAKYSTAGLLGISTIFMAIGLYKSDAIARNIGNVIFFFGGSTIFLALSVASKGTVRFWVGF